MSNFWEIPTLAFTALATPALVFIALVSAALVFPALVSTTLNLMFAALVYNSPKNPLELRVQTIREARGGYAHFTLTAKSGPKMKNSHHNIDFSSPFKNCLLIMVFWSPIKNFIPIGPKIAELWPKHVCPNIDMRAIYGKIWIFLNETNTIWFILLNYIFFAIYNSIYSKMFNLWPKNLYKWKKVALSLSRFAFYFLRKTKTRSLKTLITLLNFSIFFQG